MYCRNCGTQLMDDNNFCPKCGYPTNKVYVPVQQSQQTRTTTVWNKFYGLGKAFGIVSIATCWIPVMGILALMFSLPGIVFGALGKKVGSSTGLVLSIVATVLSPIFYVIFFAAMIG